MDTSEREFQTMMLWLNLHNVFQLVGADLTSIIPCEASLTLGPKITHQATDFLFSKQDCLSV